MSTEEPQATEDQKFPAQDTNWEDSSNDSEGEDNNDADEKSDYARSDEEDKHEEAVPTYINKKLKHSKKHHKKHNKAKVQKLPDVERIITEK